ITHFAAIPVPVPAPRRVNEEEIGGALGGLGDRVSADEGDATGDAIERRVVAGVFQAGRALLDRRHPAAGPREPDRVASGTTACVEHAGPGESLSECER